MIEKKVQEIDKYLVEDNPSVGCSQCMKVLGDSLVEGRLKKYDPMTRKFLHDRVSIGQ